MFENLLLEQQQELLLRLVEAARSVRQEPWKDFRFSDDTLGASISYPGLKEPLKDVYKSDVETLISKGLLRRSYQSSGFFTFSITPEGVECYKSIKHKNTKPLQNIETEIKTYLEAESFQTHYPIAYQKWTEAEKLLWSSDTQKQLTVIGHLCREAMQEFSDSLIWQYQPAETNSDKAKTVDRIRRVLDLRKESLGSTEKDFLDALLPYWRTVSNLVQRQEHGGQKEGQPLIWEDGRRVVFQTAIVMYEIARALSRS